MVLIAYLNFKDEIFSYFFKGHVSKSLLVLCFLKNEKKKKKNKGKKKSTSEESSAKLLMRYDRGIV